MIALLLGCAQVGTWTLEVAPAEASVETDDGCSVELTELQLVGGYLAGEGTFELEASAVDVLSGGTLMSADFDERELEQSYAFRTARFDTVLDGQAGHIAGTITCDREIAFELRTFEDVEHTCVGPLALPATTTLSLSPEVLFDDGAGAIVAADWVRADGDEDGLLDEEELEYARMSQLDYTTDAEHLLEHSRWMTRDWALADGCTPAPL